MYNSKALDQGANPDQRMEGPWLPGTEPAERQSRWVAWAEGKGSRMQTYMGTQIPEVGKGGDLAPGAGVGQNRAVAEPPTWGQVGRGLSSLPGMWKPRYMGTGMGRLQGARLAGVTRRGESEKAPDWRLQ